MLNLLNIVYSEKDKLQLLLDNNLGQKLFEFLTEKLILISSLNNLKDYFFPYIIAGAIYSAMLAWSKNNFQNNILEVGSSIAKFITLNWPISTTE